MAKSPKKANAKVASCGPVKAGKAPVVKNKKSGLKTQK